MLYWAYGSNLNVRAMRVRCPAARFVGPLTLDDGAIVFRNVADVIHCPGSVVPGGLWEITKECEQALDRYEGVASRFYLKRYLTLKVGKDVRECLYYQMRTSRGILPPSEGYYHTIMKGYEDFGLNKEILRRALEQSWEMKEPTPMLMDRWVRKGRNPLARPETADDQGDAA